ncbi:MAG: polysaccharide deacetylase family protein [Firmicutes bacterium]|nr:polysaccharide deacetylase family protein [Bacillota bacterium]
MNKDSRKKQLAFVLTALILLFATGILTINGTQTKFLHYWYAWLGEKLPATGENMEKPDNSPPNEAPPLAETDPEEESKTPPDNPLPEESPPPREETDPQQENEIPPDNPTENKGKNPIIYVGQQLIIPGGENTTSSAQVIKAGIKANKQKQIALTFDAGWLYEQTEDLLAVLDAYEVKSTFFMRALWVENHPELAKLIKSKGHIIENHSLTHGHLTQMTDEEIKNEIVTATKIIQKVTGSNPALFRPPYGEYNSRLLKILAESGYQYAVMWTVDSHDWAEEIGGKKVTTDYLVERVLQNASDKGIILMHIGGYKTVEALPSIIEGLRQQGYELVTVNEMLPPASSNLLYTVQTGDTLYSLSRRYGVTVAELIEANNL